MAQINHDLRTPLNAVIGFSDVMSAELLGPVGHPRYREYAGDIGTSGRRLLKAAEDTLAVTALLTSTARGTPQTNSVAYLVQETFSYFSPEADRRRISFNLVCEPIEPGLEVVASRQPLRQALVNLISEALARAADATSITVRAVAEDETVRLEVIVPHQGPSRAEPGSLAMSLARTLLELQGAGLIQLQTSDGCWRAVTVLDRAAQGDFFSACPAHASRIPAAL